MMVIAFMIFENFVFERILAGVFAACFARTFLFFEVSFQ